MATARFIKKFENGGVDIPDIKPGPPRIKSKVDDAYRGQVSGEGRQAAEASAAAINKAAQDNAAKAKAERDALIARKVRNVPGVTSSDTSDVVELKRIIAEKEAEIQHLLSKMAELTTRLDRVVFTLDPQK
mmetsp:Transcript_21652/g.52864  ORF Transcript_21652/g.52864 Transcript_21652/m.52864 type:complete len:131 (+) Transcript_21652:181-573(+)